MDLKKIGVVGAGIMGSGIAQSFAERQIPVILIDRDESALKSARQSITSSMMKRFEKGHLESAPEMQCLITSNDMSDLKPCDFVIEVVPENFDLKVQILKTIEDIVGDNCIIATNTSSLSVSKLQSHLRHPAKFLGVHYMNPPVKIPLIEIISGDQTDLNIAQRIHAFLKQLGQSPIYAKDTPGFVINRLLIPMLNTAIDMFANGVATAEDMDIAMTCGANFPMGPLALSDLIGLDTVLSIMQILEHDNPHTCKPSPYLLEMVKLGYLGRKTGRGFFEYTK